MFLRTLANLVYGTPKSRPVVSSPMLREVPPPAAPEPLHRQPTSGQSAPFRPLPYHRLNDKERAVLAYLDGTGWGKHRRRKLDAIAEACFSAEAGDKDRANSWARNSLRRPVACGWVYRTARGTYAITVQGRKWLHQAAGTSGQTPTEAAA